MDLEVGQEIMGLMVTLRTTEPLERYAEKFRRLVFEETGDDCFPVWFDRAEQELCMFRTMKPVVR